MEHEKHINDEDLKLDPGRYAMTLVLSKEKGGSFKGVGSGVTPNNYFNLPQKKGSFGKQMKKLRREL